MSSNLVIVALPADDDRVWKVSSEKKPHLTLLFLGDASNNPNVQQIMQFVQHATELSEHGPFYLDVDRRGELGADKADVLFFSKRSWNLKWIKQFRGQLLQNGAVKTAFDSVEQFPEWNPHLTLGYPETPAKPLNQDGFDHPLYSVSFDRIAVWTGDFEGPEFRLEYPDREMEDSYPSMAMWGEKGASAVSDLLHYGVKGMRWGVRKDVTTGASSEVTRTALAGQYALLSPTFRKHTSQDTQTKVVLFGQFAMLDKGVRADLHEASKKAALEKADKEWDRGLQNGEAFVAIHNAKADHFNAGLGAVNAKHNGDFRNTDWENPSSWKPHEKAYNADIDRLTADSLAKAANDVYMKNPSGTKKVVVEAVPSGLGGFSMRVDEVRHAAAPPKLTIQVNYIRNEEGRVTDFVVEGDTVQHAAQLGEEFLEHYGVKGMRWGVRKEQVGAGARAAGRGAKSAAKAIGRGIGDSAFESGAESGHTRQEIIDQGYRSFKEKDLPKINAKPEYAEARSVKTRLRNPRDPLVRQYRKEHREAYIKRLEQAANSMENTSGTRVYTIRERGIDLPARGGDLPRSKHFWDITTRPKNAAAHAADAHGGTTTMEVIMDEDGFITDLKQVESELAQSAIGEEFLEHYGIKGMRWGVRKSEPEAVAPSATSRVPHGVKRKTKIEADGGENHPASDDALKVAQARIKLHKSGPAALSNQELRDVATRLQLESQVTQMTRPAASKFIRDILGQQGKQGANQFVRTQVDSKIKGGKR